MRLGISSHAFAWGIGVPGFPRLPSPLTAEQLLDQAVALRVGVVQFADNLPLHTLSKSELAAFIHRAEWCRIQVEVGTAGIEPEHLRQYLRLATQVRSPILRTLLDTEHSEPAYGEVLDTLRSLLPEFARAGVCLAIENHDRFPAAVLARLLTALDSQFAGICLDTANSLGCGEGLETVVKHLGPWVVNLHAKDFRARRLPHKKGFLIEGCPIGNGQLDVPWLLAELQSLGRNPNVIIESWVPPRTTNGGDAEPNARSADPSVLNDTVKIEAEWAAQSVAYLRRWIVD